MTRWKSTAARWIALSFAEAAERLLAVARGYNGYIYQPLKDQPAGLRIGSALMEKVKGAVLKLDVEVKKSLAAAESKAAKEDEPASEAKEPA
jgi:hypothetical protein